MLKKEIRYDFQKRLMSIHRPDRRDLSLQPNEKEWALPDGVCVVVDKDAEPVVHTAAKDFLDYLLVSMGVSARMAYTVPSCCCKESAPCICVKVCPAVDGPIGYEIDVQDGCITVTGSDPAGAAQGLFQLEDRMNRRRAPFLTLGKTARKALFENRFIESPFGIAEYTDHAFAWMAHFGYNCISLHLKDSCTNWRKDTINMNLLCHRASAWGIKVYACLAQPHTAHPDDEGAQEYYDKLYSEFFASCPDLYGITLVGEANQFRSRDKNTSGAPIREHFKDNIPLDKLPPGWWPCEDYPRWVAMIRKSLDKIKPEADILFSTYNWGFADEKARIALLEAMPKKGVIISPTWDMFHQYKVGDVVEDIVDYSLSFAGPGEYFVSEAEACKRLGLRLGANAQSGGRTWDFGTVPYEPMPWAWMDRYKGMQKAHEEWGLCTITESIHYGFWPSIINHLQKEMFYSNWMDPEQCLKEILLMEFGCDVSDALRCFDDAVRLYIPTNEDQYGSFRAGPGYPLWLRDTQPLPAGGRIPANNHAVGSGFYYTYYKENLAGRNSLPGVRIHEELKAVAKMTELFKQGVEKLEAIENPNEELQRLILLGKFLYYSCITVTHAKNFFNLKHRLSCCDTRENAAKILDEIEKILLDERKNVENAMEVVQYDSRLGWEPAMEYLSDYKDLQWKLRQLDHELNSTLVTCRRSNALGTPDEAKYVDAPYVIYY